jgi:hypothetical protein
MFDSSQINVGFVVGSVVLRQVFLQVLQFYLVCIIPPVPFTFIVIIYYRCYVIIGTDSVTKEGFSLSLSLFSYMLHCYCYYVCVVFCFFFPGCQLGHSNYGDSRMDRQSLGHSNNGDSRMDRQSKLYFQTVSCIVWSWDSIVSIVTHYRLDGLGIESWWGWIFHTCPDQLWDPPSLLYSGYWVFPGVKTTGAWHWPPTPI